MRLVQVFRQSLCLGQRWGPSAKPPFSGHLPRWVSGGPLAPLDPAAPMGASTAAGPRTTHATALGHLLSRLLLPQAGPEHLQRASLGMWGHERWSGGTRDCGVASAGAWCKRKSLYPLFPHGRVINAGKSQHNEDQACCEVVFVERRPSLRGRPPSRESSGELDGVRAGAACAGRDATGRMPRGRTRDGACRDACTPPLPRGFPRFPGALPLLPATSCHRTHWTTLGLAGPGRLLAHVPWWVAEVATALAQLCLPFGGDSCWQQEVSEAGLGSSQGPAVSRYP